MKFLIERSCLITLSILMCEIANGAPVPSLDVPSVVEQSDVVVVGTVRSAQMRAQPAWTLAGSLLPRVSFAVRWT